MTCPFQRPRALRDASSPDSQARNRGVLIHAFVSTRAREDTQSKRGANSFKRGVWHLAKAPRKAQARCLAPRKAAAQARCLAPRKAARHLATARCRHLAKRSPSGHRARSGGGGSNSARRLAAIAACIEAVRWAADSSFTSFSARASVTRRCVRIAHPAPRPRRGTSRTLTSRPVDPRGGAPACLQRLPRLAHRQVRHRQTRRRVVVGREVAGALLEHRDRPLRLPQRQERRERGERRHRPRLGSGGPAGLLLKERPSSRSAVARAPGRSPRARRAPSSASKRAERSSAISTTEGSRARLATRSSSAPSAARRRGSTASSSRAQESPVATSVASAVPGATCNSSSPARLPAPGRVAVLGEPLHQPLHCLRMVQRAGHRGLERRRGTPRWPAWSPLASAALARVSAACAGVPGAPG